MTLLRRLFVRWALRRCEYDPGDVVELAVRAGRLRPLEPNEDDVMRNPARPAITRSSSFMQGAAMRPWSRFVSVIWIALLVGACSAGGSGATPSTADAGNGGGGVGTSNAPAAPSGAAGGGGGGGGGEGLAGLNACQLLTPEEIQGVIGSGVMPGVQQDSTGQTECDWTGTTDQAAAVSLSVAAYDDSLWQAGASSPRSKPVSGLGDAAYQGWPTSVTLNVKVKGYAVTIGVVSFSLADTVIDDDDAALAKIVLPKL